MLHTLLTTLRSSFSLTDSDRRTVVARRVYAWQWDGRVVRTKEKIKKIIQSCNWCFFIGSIWLRQNSPIVSNRLETADTLKINSKMWLQVDLSQHKDELLPYDLARKKRIHSSGFDRNLIRHIPLVYYCQHCRQVKHPSASQKPVESRFCSVEVHY